MNVHTAQQAYLNAIDHSLSSVFAKIDRACRNCKTAITLDKSELTQLQIQYLIHQMHYNVIKKDDKIFISWAASLNSMVKK